ncbi:MAG: cytochrome c-type biogenesis protein CcmH [Proteobacteria bacterium]|nr:cytochrome c-type biogenesis protein CcmH [Pseudomonadota bacterium]
MKDFLEQKIFFPLPLREGIKGWGKGLRVSVNVGNLSKVTLYSTPYSSLPPPLKLRRTGYPRPSVALAKEGKGRGVIFFFLFLFFIICASSLHALEAGESLADPRLEARAMALGAGIRCVVCEGESINDSPATLARDMRGMVRDKLKQGWEDEAVLSYLRQRYGEAILFRPPFRAETLPLWLAPWAVLALALLGYGIYLSKAKIRLQR